MRRRLVAAAAVLALGLSACGGSDDGGGDRTASDGRGAIRVVAGFYPLYEAARGVGGERVEVTNLTPAGAEPHDLELTTKEVDRIEDADVVLYFGHGFQPAIEKVAGRSKGNSVDLLDGLPLAEGFEEDDHADEAEEDDHADEESIDPHVWLDLELMRTLVDRIRDVFVDVDPGGRTDFEAGAGAYRAELADLDSQFQSTLQSCQRTTFVTSHAAFGYLARRYGLNQQAIAGFSPETEPDPRRMAELADLVKETGTTTVFYETLVSPRIAEALARETGVETAVLNPLEGLTRDEAKAGASYTSIMEENLAALGQGLGCKG